MSHYELLFYSVSVKNILKFVINISRLSSPIGRNEWFCSIHFNIAIQHLCTERFSCSFFQKLCMAKVSDDHRYRSDSARELVMIHDELLIDCLVSASGVNIALSQFSRKLVLKYCCFSLLLILYAYMVL